MYILLELSPMASISALNQTVFRTALLSRRSMNVSSSSVLGLPAMSKKGMVHCSIEHKPGVEESGSSKVGVGASSMFAAAWAATVSSPAAMALVDERMSTEGTGLPFGLSNNLLGWILLGVFGLIWSIFFVYTSGLDEDEDSGMSL